MCIPPNNETPEKYFKELRASNKLLGFNELSIGMSNDYKLAIENGATYIRIDQKFLETELANPNLSISINQF